MLRSNRLLTMLLLFALILSACQPITRPPTPEPQAPQGLRPDAPTYAVHGPYAVGTRDFVIKIGERTAPVTVWYPALNPEGKPETITYRIEVGDQGLPPYPVLGNAILDAPPDMSAAPYPLLIWSHGAYLYRQTNAYLVEHLASQGFIVVAGNHEDNWGTFPAPNATSNVSRPAEISAWIDWAEMQTMAGNELAGLIDSEHIAVGGHSFGGYTALAVAGARFNPTWYLNVVCANNVLAEDDPLNDCSTIEKELDELATLAGLDHVPEGLWPSWQDPRVDAIFLLAPSSVFGAEGSATVTIPTMSLTGSADPMQDVALHVYLTHENLASTNKSLVVFQDGGHTMFLNDCNAATGMADVAFEWCSDSVWNTDRVHDLTNHFVTAFLLAELKGDTEAAAALAPENVTFTGIKYETTEFGKTGTVPTANLDDATTTQIETILTNTMQSVGVSGYAMCVVRDGNVIYNKGFGVTELGGDQPVTPQSVFSVRSTTKSFTAVALMQLVEQGKVDLDAPVTTYLPYFTMADPAYKEITVRMLASHTSGLIDDESFQNMPPRSEEPAETGAAIEWFVRALADDKLTATPPTVWQYAGTNFILLGDIIGKVSGEPYDVYITKHLLEPLGMLQSTLDATTIPAGTLVGEHVTTAGGVVTATPLSNYSGFEAPEGGIFSTCDDMTRWMQVHLNRGELNGVRILKPETYELMWVPEIETGMAEFFGAWIADVAVGWAVGEQDGHLLAGHPGGGAGQNIGYQLAPDDNLGVTVLANWGTEPDAYPAWTAAADVLYALLGIGSQK